VLSARDIKAKRAEYMNALTALEAPYKQRQFYKAYIETLGFEIETGNFNTYLFIENCDRAINTMQMLTESFGKKK